MTDISPTTSITTPLYETDPVENGTKWIVTKTQSGNYCIWKVEGLKQTAAQYTKHGLKDGIRLANLKRKTHLEWDRIDQLVKRRKK